jgi:hypothetical protein
MHDQHRQGVAISADHLRHQEWAEEVERFDPKSDTRLKAKRARREIEAGERKPAWKPCEVRRQPWHEPAGLPEGLPPPRSGRGFRSAVRFVFQLARTQDGLARNFIAFGERHPGNAQTRSLYERATSASMAATPDRPDPSNGQQWAAGPTPTLPEALRW